MTSKTEIKLELAFPYDLHITPTVNGGCIVNVGCAQLSYSTPARMLIGLKKYLADPKGYENAYNECNKTRGGASNQPSLAIGSGRTVDERPEQPSPPDAYDDTARDPGEGETSEDTEPG